MRVIGLDICKDSAVGCLLDCDVRPSEPRQLYYDLDFPKFWISTEGLKALLALKPDVAVLEPTGVNYSKFWVVKLAEAGIAIALVGHKQLRGYRENLDLPDKDDPADALALACYYLDHHQSARRFVRMRDPVIAKMRDTVLRLHHLNRVQSPIVNRLKQDLTWQFPEMSKTSLDATLFWGWLAGERKSVKYDAMLQNSCGLGLELQTRHGAKALWELRKRELELELQLRSLLKDVRFLPYRKVFAEFGFGERIESLLLSQIYPLESYLLDGKPEVKIRKGKNSGNPTKRYLSSRRFQKALGMAPIREESGDKKATKKAGSSLCRTALWQWIFTRVEPIKNRMKNATGKELGELMDAEKKHKPIKLARSRVAAKVSIQLFKRLVEALTTD